MNEIMEQEPGGTLRLSVEHYKAMTQMLQGMADMLRMTNERMAELEKQVRTLEKVTPAQAADINRAIRELGVAICQAYRMSDMEMTIRAAIRKTVYLTTGARSTREIARCDYRPVRELIETWDEYSVIKRLRLKKAG